MLRPAAFLLAALVIVPPAPAAAQVLSQRGFVDGGLMLFPQDALNDPVNAVGDFLAREELFVKPAPWVQFAVGFDLRGNTHDQVESSWAPDFGDRGARRPLWSVRRLAATVHYRWLTVDAGKQFIRWGKADIVTPTDHFAPRDYLNVVDNEFLGVTGVRGVVQAGGETLDIVFVPRLTPSRTPLPDQRWTVVAPAFSDLTLVDGGAQFPDGVQAGVRWSHIARSFEFSASYFGGFNHQPNVDVHVPFVPGELILTRSFPAIRSIGADAAMPTRWFTIKGEAAYFDAPDATADEYVLYVLQLERLAGEWVFVAGYAGEAVTERNRELTFAPDRGLARSIVARASYTIDVNRSAAVEGAVRQNGHGGFVKAEYSQAKGQHWRMTLGGTLIAGEETDFLGQYHRNSHFSAALRYSF